MLKTKLMNIGKKIGRVFGLEIKRTKSVDFNYTWLECQNIQTIIDIGANEGQFAKKIHKILPKAKVYSFEPLNDCYCKLVSNLKHISGSRAFNFALGDVDDNNVEMRRSIFSPSSSLLKMAKLHKEEFPYTDGEMLEKISIRRLDGIANELDMEDNILVKIDVQGFEEKVITGGTKTISMSTVVIIESSIEQLYEGQSSVDRIVDIMRKMGFAFKGCWDQLKSPIDGRVLSCDLIFMRITN
jgi:FkbM family methyltransferase